MKRVTAYKSLDDSLHESKAASAGASIIHLGKTLNNDQRGTSIDACAVAFLIDNRNKILPLLDEIDAVDADPD